MTASPVRFISSALLSPTSRGRRWVPPKPGMIPSLISGWPKIADWAAMRTSQAIASSQPPPNAIELTAAIVATRLLAHLAQQRRGRELSSSAPCDSSIFVNALMSAPAENTTGIDEAMTSDRTSPSSVIFFHTVPQVLDDLRRDRVHRRVRQPRDRDAVARASRA